MKQSCYYLLNFPFIHIVILESMNYGKYFFIRSLKIQISYYLRRTILSQQLSIPKKIRLIIKKI